MKVVIFNSEKINEIIEHFVAYGFDSFTVFAPNELKIDFAYYELNNISVTVLKGFSNERNIDKLKKIKGSLQDTFFVVYSNGIYYFDIENAVKKHRKNQVAVTALQSDNRLSALICENEIFDFFGNFESLEGDVVRSFGEQGELAVLKADI